MFKVEVSTLAAYLDWDPDRKQKLLLIDSLIRRHAPYLKRWFYKGSSAGAPGMRMRLIGYGWFLYSVKSGETVKWPIIGLALQKHYISVYLSVFKNNEPVLDDFKGKLGALRYGGNNFSFSDPEKLDFLELARLLKAVNDIVKTDPDHHVFPGTVLENRKWS